MGLLPFIKEAGEKLFHKGEAKAALSAAAGRAVMAYNLSKIAKHCYDNANKYPVIFEANQPMLSHPDKIYPGQLLRIPPL